MGYNSFRWIVKIVYRQLDIYWVDLEPAQGSETQKKRPCVIIQSDLLNKGTRTVIVAPILPGHKDWPFSVNIIPTNINQLDQTRHINMKQMRAVDVSRIDNMNGSLEQSYLADIRETLRILF